MHAKQDDPCWEWPAKRTPFGYGMLRTAPAFGVEGEHVPQAHRWMYEQVHGPLRPGVNVLHTCDNPPCFNPAHLYTGSQQDNVRDAWTRGRARGYYEPGDPRISGENAHGAKLTALQAGEVRRLRRDGWLLSELADRFGVYESTISMICRNLTWREDDGEAKKPPPARRTTCPKGHPYDEANTYNQTGSKGGRTCRICHAERERNRRAKLREATP